MSNEVAVREPSALAVRYELEVEDLIAQVQKIQALMVKVMKQDEHFGVIPGTGTKPTLLKPGAEKLCLLFRLAPEYKSDETYDGKHLTVKTTCSLWHIPTGQRWGTGEGSCSTKESKYAYRKAERTCPKCSTPTIRKSKDGGWFCWRKLGGCGSSFPDGTGAIENQKEGRIPNEDVADQYNTVLKMSNKRALVAAVLNVTAASDIFTQDLEETHDTPTLSRGEIIEASPATTTYDQNIADRERLLEQIKVDSRFLGVTKATYKENWKTFVGRDDSETAAPIASLFNLAAHLAERVMNVKKGQATTLAADPAEPAETEGLPF